VNLGAKSQICRRLPAMMSGVGALVTLDLPADAPALTLPWIITFGPLSDIEEWEPVVCGPYERAHALALAESVVADEELMAVVEPVQPHVSVQQIRTDIAAARLSAEREDAETVALDAELAGYDFSTPELDLGLDFRRDVDPDAGGVEPVPPSDPPAVDEVRAGFARIAAKLTSG
jgi:hypothetical protein